MLISGQMAHKKTSQKRSRERDEDEQKVLRKLGKIISALAAQRKIGLKQLAYEAEVSKGFIYDLAKGKGNPSILLLHRIAKAHDLTLSKLLNSL